MRTKKASINALVGVIAYILGYLPIFIIRKVFLDILGEDLLGLSSLYTNIINYLSIVEMGIGSAIIFSLYKPFSENDRVKIKGYLDCYKKFYRIAGIVVLVLGLLLVPILPIFINDKASINMNTARFCFILVLADTLITYFFSYKLCLLNVAQESFRVAIGTSLSKLAISILQIVVLNIYPNFALYIAMQIVVNATYYTIINRYIDRRYKWVNEVEGHINDVEKKDLFKNIKALFLHKIGSVVVFGTDSLVISTFINLATVARYNTYQLFLSAVTGIMGNAMNAITPSIGNLLVEKDKKSAYIVHRRLFFMNFWLVSFITICLYNTLTQFVRLVYGESQVLSSFTINILLINLYFQLMRNTVERFKEGSGSYYQDRYAPLFEAIINLGFSLYLVNKIGLPGVFIGTLISNLTAVFWVKPLITYKNVFNVSVFDYFKMYFKFLFIGIIPLFLTHLLTVNIKSSNSFLMFIVNCIINIVVINVFYLIVFWKNEDFKFYKNYLNAIVSKFIKHKA